MPVASPKLPPLKVASELYKNTLSALKFPPLKVASILFNHKTPAPLKSPALVSVPPLNLRSLDAPTVTVPPALFIKSVEMVK